MEQAVNSHRNAQELETNRMASLQVGFVNFQRFKRTVEKLALISLVPLNVKVV